MEQTNLQKLPAPLLAWYDEHRRVLPWREQVSPYRTWVSEIMLQQTRVQAVLPYFQRFMEAAPDVQALAALPEEQLMRLWQGLGYYSRARNLKKAAQTVVEDFGGVFPDSYDGLRRLAGVGDYTAGAILSIAFGQPVPAVDGNVLRVAARLTGDSRNVLEPKVRADFRCAMAETMPHDRPGDFNQALMDLGAAVCLPGGNPCANNVPPRRSVRHGSRGHRRSCRYGRRKRRSGRSPSPCLPWCGRMAPPPCGSGRRTACWRDSGSFPMWRVRWTRRQPPASWRHGASQCCGGSERSTPSTSSPTCAGR